ncbi:hypothetical protein PsorP6_010978 [Peronosclerospora sorghi]|uniref:Uncharacterized protein n=1 Tax=Peronosclerospora sorghi TaxID=230839 RepID=A0ACC0VXC4_9STRA|nr:hypothetical protein PsorP6_010978 [Peronosclerospora sorghi]
MPRSRSRSSSRDSLGRARRRHTSPRPRRRRHRSDSSSRSSSRSRSRRFRRRRSRSLSRSIERRSRSRRSFSRSRSRGRRSMSRGRYVLSRATMEKERPIETTDQVPQGKPEEEDEEVNSMSHLSEEERMKLLLGFGTFDSTKGKCVEENRKSAAVGTARREIKREYRQYMNRRGGFNRPLDKT